MEIIELEKIRDYVCRELTTDPLSADSNELIQALIQIPIRDGCLRYLFDHQEAREMVALNLEQLLTECVNHERAAVATVLAGCYWLDANMQATRTALDSALEADSTYSLARLLDVALKHGVPATVWADSLAAVSPEQCLTGAA